MSQTWRPGLCVPYSASQLSHLHQDILASSCLPAESGAAVSDVERVLKRPGARAYKSSRALPLACAVRRRMQYKPHLIRFDEVKEECVTGKNHIYHAADKYNRPIVLMRPRCAQRSTQILVAFARTRSWLPEV